MGCVSGYAFVEPAGLLRGPSLGTGLTSARLTKADCWPVANMLLGKTIVLAPVLSRWALLQPVALSSALYLLVESIPHARTLKPKPETELTAAKPAAVNCSCENKTRQGDLSTIA